MQNNKYIKNNKILVIMESPTKTKAVQNYLGDDYIVTSSEGHIRNLSSTGHLSLGIDLETFTPKYRLEKNKKPIVEKLKKLSKNSPLVILATDPDREGEAIAFHLKEVLKIDEKYKRVTFNEITKDIVIDAFANLKSIDMNLFKSQETRRILDRIIGYRLSKLLYKKIKSKSAGRVQSVTLKILVKRETEINIFTKEEYWTIEGTYNNNLVKLNKYNDKKMLIQNQEQVEKIGKELSEVYTVKNIINSSRIKKPPKPFKTSSLLQKASNNLNFSPAKTSLIAQQLYEGIKIENNLQGLITYPRTDSQRLSETFIKKTFSFISKKYGNKYLGEYNYKIDKNTQNAHEAIRPTDPELTPYVVRQYLKPDQYKIYKLIYNNAVASLMANAIYENQKILLINNGYEFNINLSKMIFDGFLKFLKLKNEDDELTILEVNDKIKLTELKGIQHFTSPPPRYNIASLIKKLEELGIGRPSTYSMTIYTLQKRGYVNIVNKVINPTEKGILTNKMLQEYFYDIIDETYTSSVEDKLDKIANGKIEYLPILKDFWDKFEPRILNALEKMPEIPVEKVNLPCPDCNKDLVYRYGPYGKFIACSGFPKCRYILQKETVVGKCPDCKVGNAIIKMNKRKTKILVCNRYPECNYIENYKEKPSKSKINKENDMAVKLFEINILKST